jgi:membrane-associated HD superfamily phosphohydrolase
VEALRGTVFETKHRQDKRDTKNDNRIHSCQKKMKLQVFLIKVHFIAFTIAIFNGLAKGLMTYSLESNVELAIEMATVLTGFILFFFYLRPFKKINCYFSIYPVVASLVIITIIYRSLFWGLVLSVILFPIVPNQKEYDHDGIRISVPFRGFISSCCFYQVKERKLFFFEKDYGVFESEGPINFKEVNVEQTENELLLSYPTDENKIKRIVF